MESPSKSALFQVYLRLRPPPSQSAQPTQPTQPTLYPQLPPIPERFLTVETPSEANSDGRPTHITLHPPSDSRKRAVEKFAFTKVFEEVTTQLDIFKDTGAISLVDGVLNQGRDGLIATLGVTGSGKSHTILGSKSQRGLTQMSLDLVYSSLDSRIVQAARNPSLISSISEVDASEAHIYAASAFFEGLNGDGPQDRMNSRAATPMTDHSFVPSIPKRNIPQRLSTLPQLPNVGSFALSCSTDTEYAILVSMYEVYNDRIFDLLSSSRNTKELRRRQLLFKSTEGSPDRKVVAGLRKVVCGSYEEALMVLETGLIERAVAGTGSNSVSSRSHGFFCLEVKRRAKGYASNKWKGAQLTVVDLAGSERARNAKTAGATLAEAGKINESLMYLGQCLQMQSDCNDGTKPSIVPFRQCKLTELLFSNSFPSSSHHSTAQSSHVHRNPQKAVMIVTADPVGDFNATSQILRYSALAREVTAPRIPSLASTILAGLPSSNRSQMNGSGRSTPNDNSAELEAAIQEAERLNDEVEILALRLAEEQVRRREAEKGWQKSEERAEEIEVAIREECFSEMEKKIEEERRRWMGAWGEEADRNDEHVDRKLEILTRGIQIHEDTPNKTSDYVNKLEDENTELHRRLGALQREMQCRSPTKAPRNPHSSALVCEDESVDNAAIQLRDLQLNQAVPSAKPPGRKIRKLTPRNPIFGDENLDFLDNSESIF